MEKPKIFIGALTISLLLNPVSNYTLVQPLSVEAKEESKEIFFYSSHYSNTSTITKKEIDEKKIDIKGISKDKYAPTYSKTNTTVNNNLQYMVYKVDGIEQQDFVTFGGYNKDKKYVFTTSDNKTILIDSKSQVSYAFLCLSYKTTSKYIDSKGNLVTITDTYIIIFPDYGLKGEVYLNVLTNPDYKPENLMSNTTYIDVELNLTPTYKDKDTVKENAVKNK